MDDATPRIAEYIAAAAATTLPTEVEEKTKLHLLDSIAAILSGSKLKAGVLGHALVERLGGLPEATVLGTSFVTSAPHAALANGMAAHADETDDSHLAGRFHPGSAIVPAALAMAERGGRNGAELLRAVALGYDIGARATLALGFSGPRSGTHSTHSLGAIFGATAAAGALAGLSGKQCVYLLSYAVQQASGVPYWQRDSDHVEKAFDFGGMGARNGVYAALMVEAGWTGVSDPLLGAHGFLDAFAEKADAAALTMELGERFEIMGAAIKKWCVGSPIQAALDSLLALMTEHRLEAGRVQKLTVHIPDDRFQIVDNAEMPDVCVQHLLALMLVDGGLTFQSSHDKARMQDPAVLDVRQRIAALPSAELTIARPARQAIIEIETHGGARFSHRTRAVLGTPENPMSVSEVSAKARDLIERVIGAEKTNKLVQQVLAIERLASVRALQPLLKP
jgi:2-methylcitrate dehydratase PrpD